MIPELFHLGPIPVHSFGLMVALCFFAGTPLLARSFARNGAKAELAERYIFVGGFVGLAGARIWYVLFHSEQFMRDPIDALISGGGFTFYGGFIFAWATLAIMAKRDGMRQSQLLDSMGPTLALAYAIGRLGCQLSGDGDYGIVTDSIFGMSFAQGVIPTAPGVLVYPTPFFESVFSLFALWILLTVEQKKEWKTASFSRWGLYLMLMAVERFLIEFIRVEQKFIWGLSEAQLLALGLLIVGLTCLSFGFRSRAA